MEQSEIDKQLNDCEHNSYIIKSGIAMAALHIVEGDLTKEAVLSLLDIEIKRYQDEEVK